MKKMPLSRSGFIGFPVLKLVPDKASTRFVHFRRKLLAEILNL